MALLDFFNKRNADAKGEMTFIDYLEELRWHVIRSVIAILIGAVAVFVYSDFVIDKIVWVQPMIISFLIRYFAPLVIHWGWAKRFALAKYLLPSRAIR